MMSTQQTTELILQPATQRAISGFDELWGMAAAVAKSNLFAVKNTEEAVTLMMLAQAEGVHPIQAMRMYHIINGRPSMRADAMQAKFQQRGGRVRWVVRSDDRVTAEFSHPDLQPEPIVVTWDNDRVKKAGLSQGNHNKFPTQMKAARVISEGVGAIMPEVKMGLYAPEEVEDFQPTSGPPRPTAESRVIDAQVMERPLDGDAKFLVEWDAAGSKHGVSNDDGRVVLAAMLRRRSTEFSKADAEAREAMLGEYRSWTPEQVAAFNAAQAKKRAEKEKPAEAAPKPPADQWTAFVADLTAAGAADGQTPADIAAKIDELARAFGVPTNMIPQEQLTPLVESARAKKFDWTLTLPPAEAAAAAATNPAARRGTAA
jgi:hypothetical protein